MAVIRLEEPTARPPQPPEGFALFALGFRPFYLLAALWATLAVPVWIGQYLGLLPMPPALPALFWHAHEMVFGFAAAVIIGFILTAARTWTGIETPSGMPLALLALLWIAGRIALWLAPFLPSAIIDTSFLFVSASVIGQVIWRARSQRNYFIVALLLALTGANAAFHLIAAGVLHGNPMTPLHAAIALITLLATIIAGRIVPNFTANALRGVGQFQNEHLNMCAIGFTGCALLAWVGEAAPWAVVGTALIAALLQAIRCWGWNPWATRRTPLLWSLHVAHAWIPIGLVLVAASQAGWILPSPAWHALTIGAMSGLILAMITRTALGHTGRMLVAGRRETGAYLLLQVGALLRVAGVLTLPTATRSLLIAAMLAWSSAFVLYLWKYTPILLRPRVDGKKG